MISIMQTNATATENFVADPKGHAPTWPKLQGTFDYQGAENALTYLFNEDWKNAKKYFRDDIEGYSLPDIRDVYLDHFTYIQGGDPEVRQISTAEALTMLDESEWTQDATLYQKGYASMVFYDGGTDGTWLPKNRSKFLFYKGTPVIDVYCLNPVVQTKSVEKETEERTEFQEEPQDEPQERPTPKKKLPIGYADNSINNSNTVTVKIQAPQTSSEPVVTQTTDKKNWKYVVGAVIGYGVTKLSMRNNGRGPVRHGGGRYTRGGGYRRPPPRRFNTSSLSSEPPTRHATIRVRRR